MKRSRGRREWIEFEERPWLDRLQARRGKKKRQYQITFVSDVALPAGWTHSFPTET